MHYDSEIIQEVIDKNDIVDVISSVVSLKRVGSGYQGLCPFHNEKTGSFSVSPTKQMFYCFGCHVGGNVATFIQKYENKTFPEAIEYLAERAGVVLPQKEMSEEEKYAVTRRGKLLEIHKKAAYYFYRKLYSEEGKVGIEYFKKRGLNPETIKKFGLGYSGGFGRELHDYLINEGYDDNLLRASGLFSFTEKGTSDRFFNRVMFPIMDKNNKVIAFGGRVTGEGRPKYLNSPETEIFSKRQVMYGMNIARHSRESYLLLCEGYMDVIALHNAGFDSAVAALGTAFTENNAAIVARETDNVILSFDNDGAGKSATLRAIEILDKYEVGIKVVDMTPFKDPDEFIKNKGSEAYKERILNADDAFLFRVKMKREENPWKTPGDKVNFLIEVCDMLMELGTDLIRDEYIKEICARYNFDYDKFNSFFKRRALDYVPPVKKVYTTDVPEKKSKEELKTNSLVTAEKMLLTWIAEHPDKYKIVKNYISAEDFDEELCKEAAKRLFKQFEEGSINIPMIVNDLAAEEDDDGVAGIFNTPMTVTFMSEDDDERHTDKNAEEIIRKIKLDKIEKKLASTNDLKEIQECINEQKKLKNLKIFKDN